MPRGVLVLVGAVEYTGPSEDLPPRVALPFIRLFNSPQPRDAVGDPLLLSFKLGASLDYAWLVLTRA